MRCSLDRDSTATLVHAFVTSRIDYDNALLTNWTTRSVRVLVIGDDDNTTTVGHRASSSRSSLSHRHRSLFLRRLGRNHSTSHAAPTVDRNFPKCRPVEDRRWSASTAVDQGTSCLTEARGLPRCLENPSRKHLYSFCQLFPGHQTSLLMTRLPSRRRNRRLILVFSNIVVLLNLLVRIPL